jgi:hypothetical protein
METRLIMALNPLRDVLTRSGLEASRFTTPFQAQAQDRLTAYRAARSRLEQEVRRGELTVRVARTRARAEAGALERDLLSLADTFSSRPPALRERLAEVRRARLAAAAAASLESLQRETNRLLRESLLEQQVINRSHEFEGQAYTRPLSGGTAVPTLESLLSFHARATAIEDAPAREWARRQLEAMRERYPDPEDQKRIDLASDRPERVNPSVVARYVDRLTDATEADLDRFAEEAVAAHDASACCAAFSLARSRSDLELEAPWVARLLRELDRFPEAAITTLWNWETEAREAETEAARAVARFAADQAASESELRGLIAPTEEDLERRARLAARPLASAAEPIGLTASRRGLDAVEFAALDRAPEAPVLLPSEPTTAEEARVV